MNNTANLQLVEFSAASLAAQYEANKNDSGTVRAMLRNNYTPEKLQAFVEAVMTLRSAKKTADVRELGTVIKNSVPRDDDKRALCAPLTVSFKAVKEFGSADKRITARIIEAAPAKKPDSVARTLSALYAIVDANAQDLDMLRGVQVIGQALESATLTDAQGNTLSVILEHCEQMLAE